MSLVIKAYIDVGYDTDLSDSLFETCKGCMICAFKIIEVCVKAN